MTEVQVRCVEAQRFALQEGDKLVLTVPEDMLEDADHIATQVAAQFPGHALLVLCGGIELGVIGRSADG